MGKQHIKSCRRFNKTCMDVLIKICIYKKFSKFNCDLLICSIALHYTDFSGLIDKLATSGPKVLIFINARKDMRVYY